MPRGYFAVRLPWARATTRGRVSFPNATAVSGGARVRGLLGRSIQRLYRIEKGRRYARHCRSVKEVVCRSQERISRVATQRRQGIGSHKDQIYGLPDEVERVEHYVPLEVLRRHAKSRVASGRLLSQVLTAWLSVLEEKRLYEKDGSEAED